jgi:hypothetical protein
MKRVYLYICLAVALIIYCSGCVGYVKILTDPEEAKLFVNGEYKGVTPKSVPFRFWPAVGETLSIRIVRDG